MFWYVTGFRPVQSVIVAALSLGVCYSVCISHVLLKEHTEELTKPKIKPFYFRIQPDWDRILKEFDLWDDFVSDVQNREDDELYLPSDQAITVTVLRRGLYSINRSFSTNVEYTVFGWRCPLFPMPDQELPTQFYVRESSVKCGSRYVGVYEFGLAGRLRSTTPQKRLEFPLEGLTREGRLPIARLPRALFEAYYSDDEQTDNTLEREKLTKRLAEEYGWVKEECRWPDYDDPFRDVTRMKHKYVTIESKLI